jgi:O-antigen/teichoic acid export membrane protein
MTAIRPMIGRARSLWNSLVQISHFGSLLFLTVLADMLLAGLAVISGVLAARLLGPTGRGELAAIQIWPNFLASFAMLGVPAALAYFSAREPQAAGRWLTTGVTVALVGCVPAALIGFVAMPWLLRAQSDTVIGAARNYLWLLPIFATEGMLHHPLRGRNDLAAWNLVRLMPSAMWVGVLALSFVDGGRQSTVVAQRYLIGLALLFFPMAYVVLRHLPNSYAPSRTMVQPLLAYGLPSMLSVLPATANLRLDQMLMARSMAPELLGLYAVGVAWSGAVAPITSALSATILPRVAGSESPEEQARRLAQMTRLGSLVAVAMALVIAAAGPLAIPLIFGQEFLPAAPAAIILAIAAGALAMKDMLAAGALSLGKPKFVLLAELVGLGMTAALLLMLLRPFQLIGAAVASLVSYGVVAAVLGWLISRQTRAALGVFFLPTRADGLLVVSRLADLRSAWARRAG